ncbi:MAG TPA: FAD-binding protein [Opitutaceae bacterium]|nr:FAD-binding protein [Opitutaceae bacterium]
MGNPTLTEDAGCDWPARFGSWAERSPETRTLCRTERRIPWRLRPPTIADVGDVLREAVRNRTPLFPISRGRNWGYGSHVPFQDGSIVLDLGGLDAIGDLDRDSLSVRIEPGVTQAELHEYLRAHAPDLAFNVTGAGNDTSVLGNALDRGMGYGGEKDNDVYAIEALLADGSSVGPRPGRNHRSRQQPAGFSTDELFFQSNLGIVVGARLRLRVRQQAEDAVILQGPLEAMIATLKRAYEQHLVTRPTHIAEPGRIRRVGFGLLRSLWGRDPTPKEVARCFPENGTYSGLVPLHGRRMVVDAAWEELKAIAAPGVKLQRVNASKLDFAATWLARVGARHLADRIRAMRPILALTWGVPSDAGLTALEGYGGGDPDLAGRGAIYGNAVSSLDWAEGGRAMGIVKEHWSDCAFTWILVDSACMLTIYTLHFDDSEAADVHRANAGIIGNLRSAGLPQYRLDINTPAAPGAEGVVRRLKAAFDPLGLIAPGRYESRCADA